MEELCFDDFDELVDEFEEENGRLPTPKEQDKLWERAEERALDRAIAAAEARYEGDR